MNVKVCGNIVQPVENERHLNESDISNFCIHLVEYYKPRELNQLRTASDSFHHPGDCFGRSFKSIYIPYLGLLWRGKVAVLA